MVVNERIELKDDVLFIDDLELKEPKKLGKFWKYKIGVQEGCEIGILLYWDRVFWGEDYSDFKAYLYCYKPKRFFEMLSLFNSQLAGDINLLTYELPKLVKKNGDLIFLMAISNEGYRVDERDEIYGELQFVASDLFDVYAGKVIRYQMLRETIFGEFKNLFNKFSDEIAPRIFFDNINKDTEKMIITDILSKVLYDSGDYARNFITMVRDCEKELSQRTEIECLNDYVAPKMDNSIITRLTVYEVNNELRVIMWIVMGIYQRDKVCETLKKVLVDSKSPLTTIVYNNGKVEIIPINEAIFEKPKGFIFSQIITDFKKLSVMYSDLKKLAKEVGYGKKTF